MTLKLVTLNVNGIAEKPKRTKIFNFLRLLNADFYALQETHNETDTDERNWENEWGGPCFWSRGTHHSCGVALLVNPRVVFDVDNLLTDNDGRVLVAKLLVDGTEFNLMTVYAPTNPAERKLFFNNMWRYQTGRENLLVVGDFNCVEDLVLDKLGGNPNSGHVGINELTTFTHTNNLVDAWRQQHPQACIYTWHNRDFSIRSRLDRWYIPQPLITCSQAHIRACPHSDHSVAELSLSIPSPRRQGPRTWKLNTSILTDEKYRCETITFIQYWSTRKPTFNDLRTWWDEGKLRLKGIAIKHCVSRSRNRKKVELELIRELTRLKNLSTPDLQAIDRVEQELVNIADEKARGAQIRSRAAWVENGEKPTRYFFKLEKRKQTRSCINELATPEPRSVKTDP